MFDYAAYIKAAGLSPRHDQEKYAESICDAMCLPGKISLLHAATGIGKSLGYLLPFLSDFQRNNDMRCIVATHSHALMEQITGKDRQAIEQAAKKLKLKTPSFASLLGLANFISPERLARWEKCQPDITAQARRLLNKFEAWDDTIEKFIDHYGSLPDNMKASEVCRTPSCDNKAFKEEQKINALSDVVVTTHAMLAMDMMLNHAILGADARPAVLIVDEADQFIDYLKELQQKRLNLIQFRSKVADLVSDKDLEPLTTAIDAIRDAAQGRRFFWGSEVESLIESSISDVDEIAKKSDDDELLRDVMFLKQFSGGKIGLGVSTIREEPAIIKVNPYFSRYFAKYADSFVNCILTSGTLCVTRTANKGMAWVRNELGIEQQQVLGIERVHTPEDYGKMAFTLAGKQFPDVFIREPHAEPVINPDWIEGVCDHVESLSSRVVVLTGSHKESTLINACLSVRKSDRVIHHHQQGEKLSAPIASFKKESGIFITAAGFTGLDIRNKRGGQFFADLVITRIPHPPIDSDMLESRVRYLQGRYPARVDVERREATKSHLDGENKAIRKMMQGLGRGIRSEKDNVTVSILDSRFPVFSDISSRHRYILNVVPDRFIETFSAAAVISPEATQEIEIF